MYHTHDPGRTFFFFLANWSTTNHTLKLLYFLTLFLWWLSFDYIQRSNLILVLQQQWDSDLVEAKYIKDLADNLNIIWLRFGDASKPHFKNREFIVYERRETMEDGTMVITNIVSVI